MLCKDALSGIQTKHAIAIAIAMLKHMFRIKGKESFAVALTSPRKYKMSAPHRES